MNAIHRRATMVFEKIPLDHTDAIVFKDILDKIVMKVIVLDFLHFYDKNRKPIYMPAMVD